MSIIMVHFIMLIIIHIFCLYFQQLFQFVTFHYLCCQSIFLVDGMYFNAIVLDYIHHYGIRCFHY